MMNPVNVTERVVDAERTLKGPFAPDGGSKGSTRHGHAMDSEMIAEAVYGCSHVGQLLRVPP